MGEARHSEDEPGRSGPDDRARLEDVERERLARALRQKLWVSNAHGVPTWVSPDFLAYSGASPGPGGDVSQWVPFVHRDDRAFAAQQGARALATGEELRMDIRLRSGDGTYRWHLVTSARDVDASGQQVWYGLAVDIDDHKRAELALRESERRLRAILDGEPECVKIISAGGSLIEMNDAGLAMIEADRLEDVAGADVAQLVHPDDREIFRQLHRAAAAGEKAEARFRIIGLRGTQRWLESTSVPLARDDDGPPDVLSITRDVTDRVRDERLRDAEMEILSLITADTDPWAVVERIAHAADAISDGRASILLVEDGQLHTLAAPSLPPEYCASIDGLEVGPNVGSCGSAAYWGQQVITVDIDTDPRWSNYRELGRAHGLAACWSIPVFDADRNVVATFAQYFDQPREPTAAELAFAERAAQLVSIVLDRARKSESSRRNAALMSMASKIGHLGGWSVDLANGRVTWSDEVREIYGLPPGTTILFEEGIDRYAPEYRPMIRAAFERCATEGVPWTLELQVVRPDGERVWVNTTGSPVRNAAGDIVGIEGAFQDISDRKASEHALRESEERFRTIAATTSDVVWDWDVVEDRVWRSDGTAVMLGLPAGSIDPTVEAWRTHIHEDDLDRAVEAFETLLTSGETEWSVEYRIRRVDGAIAHILERATVVRDAQGQPVRVIGSTVDRTRERQLEQQLAQAQRLEAIGQLTGGVAHDFNNLLTVILGNAEMLVEQLREDSPARMLAETSRDAALRGAELTAQLLAFARRQPLHPSTVDIGSQLRTLRPLLVRSLGEDVVLTIDTGDDVWPALVDTAQLEAAVLNLCINARDAMRSGGSLTITVANAELDESIPGVGADVRPGGYVSVTVSDTGTGMSDDVQARAFDPFFTTKPVGSGSGLGLSMVYGFAKQSLGHVSLSSEPGTGTTVRLYLPRAAAAPPPPDDRSSKATNRPIGGSETLLVVEDDDLVREHVTRQLEVLGYRVVAAPDGPSALAILDEGLSPDLLLTDIVMPGMNGRALADAALERLPHLPVLFSSGYAQDALVHDGRIDPGVMLLGKPYRLADLAEMVRRAIDGRSVV